jgi:uncharacterized protein YfaP (DUF2135 family)
MLMATTAACNLLGEDESPPVIENYVTGIQVLAEAGESQSVVNQQLGAGSADGPAAQVQSLATVVNGGSVQETITSDQEFTMVRVALEELSSPAPSATDATAEPPQPSGTPALGYHEIKLKQASTEVAIVVTVAQSLPGQQFALYFAVVNAAGTQGPLAAQSVQAIGVGTGNVQVSVSWNVDSDLDLHVVDPSGEEVYYGNDQSASGGQLDLDSNPNCDIDGTRNENITWQEAPAGTYTVRVDLYEACGVTPTEYVVTIQVVGQPTQTFTGTIEGEGDVGGEGSGVQVATFEVPESAAAPQTST